jgi:hypothetical protein
MSLLTAGRNISPLFESVLPEFDRYLLIYIFSPFQFQFQPQNEWDQVLMVQLYILLSAWHVFDGLSLRRKLINFVSQIFLAFVPEISVGITSYTVQIITIYFTWIL